MARYSAAQIYAFALDAGFSKDEAVTMTAIALAESGGRNNAHATRGEDSRGLWQINAAAHPDLAGRYDLFDPRQNALAAYEVSRGGADISPWTTTHGGTQATYVRFRADAQAAAVTHGDPPGLGMWSGTSGYGDHRGAGRDGQASDPVPVAERVPTGEETAGSGEALALSTDIPTAADPLALATDIPTVLGTPPGEGAGSSGTGPVVDPVTGTPGVDPVTGAQVPAADDLPDDLPVIGDAMLLSPSVPTITSPPSPSPVPGAAGDGAPGQGAPGAGDTTTTAGAGVGAPPVSVDPESAVPLATAADGVPTIPGPGHGPPVPPGADTVPPGADTVPPGAGPVSVSGPPAERPAASGSSAVDAFVDAALAQRGDAYVMGARAPLSDPDPDVFDCAELVVWAAHQAGTRMPDGSWLQYLDLERRGALIPVEEAVETRGALLFSFSSRPVAGGGRPTHSHVAISLGDGKTIEARGRAYGVGEFSATNGRFQYAAVIPGLGDASARSGAQAATTTAAETLDGGDALPLAVTQGADPGTGAVLPGYGGAALDTDRDGLLDDLERRLGLDPYRADSDADLLSDSFEVLVGATDPTRADNTADTLDHLLEGAVERTADQGQADQDPDASSALPLGDPSGTGGGPGTGAPDSSALSSAPSSALPAGQHDPAPEAHPPPGDTGGPGHGAATAGPGDGWIELDPVSPPATTGGLSTGRTGGPVVTGETGTTHGHRHDPTDAFPLADDPDGGGDG